MSERVLKPERDYTKEVDQLLPEAESTGKVRIYSSPASVSRRDR